MASDYAIKNATQREMLENLDREHKKQLNQVDVKQRQEMEQIRNEHAINKHETVQSQKQQLENLKATNDTFVQQERLTHQERLAQQKLQAQQDYQKAAIRKQQDNAKLKLQTESEKENYIQQREILKHKTQATKEKAELELQAMDKEGRFRVQQKRAQNAELEESTQKHHNSEMQRMEQANQKFLVDSKVKFAQKEHDLKTNHQHNLNKNEQHFHNLQQRQHNHYHEKIQQDEEFFQKQIQDQNTEYTKRYSENQRIDKASLENQKNRYYEELFKIRKNFVATADFYEERKMDPFYQLVDFGAKFVEGESFYQVEAKIPEHEMENVRVHVQPEKITLHATRMHDQDFAAGNEKIASNNSQSIRQEFTFDKPTDHKNVVKSYKDGVLSVLIPKKGYRLG